MSHVTTTPATRGASLEAANLSVAAIRAGHAPDCTNVTSQKTRTWKGHNKRLAILLAEKSPLDTPTKVALVDNANPIGGAWLYTIPATKQLQLSHREIAVGLNIRSLSLGTDTGICSACSEVHIPLHHAEVCRKLYHFQTERHENVKYRLGKAAKETGAQVLFEQPVTTPGSSMSTDLTIIGASAPNGTASDCDLTFSSLTPTAINSQVKPYLPPPTSRKNIEGLIQSVLDLRAMMKIEKYSEKTKYAVTALVFSSSGTMHSAVQQWFQSLRKMGLDLSALYKDLSVILLRSRAVSFLFH